MPNKILTEAIDRVAGGNDLTEDEAAAVLDEIMSGNSSDILTAAFLTALRTKGESVSEIVGLARTMREYSSKVDVADYDLVDTCGTGGDRSGTFNISTAAAFVVAGANARVAKHGNRSATSQCGSADVLEALGVRLELSPDDVADCIRETGIGFMFAPLHHQAMKHVVPVRKELGIRTIFNFLGPLTNPAGAEYQLIGVASLDYLEALAEALRTLGCKHGMVVHGSDGLDEITITGPTEVAEVRGGGEVRRYTITPQEFGLSPVEDRGILRGGSAEENAKTIEAILDGETGGRRDIVLLNAGAALYVAGLAESIDTGIELAAGSIDSGAARSRLKAFVAATKQKAS